MPADATRRAPASCPDCGRPITGGRPKLCPQCGYPLMFDSGFQVEEETQPEFLHKPILEERPRDTDTGVSSPYVPAPQVVGPQHLLGPHCPGCGHRSPANRVRCEICGRELWPGAAAPVRGQIFAPPAPAPPRRRRSAWLTAAAFVGAAVAAAAVVYFLAYALG